MAEETNLGDKQTRVGTFSSRMKDLEKPKVVRSSGSILKRFKETQETTEEEPISDVISGYSSSISEYDFGNLTASDIIDELEDREKRPKTRADGVGATAVAKGANWKEISRNSLIQFEGFKDKAYWDVDHYRVGYGTDTLYDDTGKPVEVTQDTVVSKEQALKSLEKRITDDFVPIIKNTIGESWNSLSDNAKAAAVSITYNYGRVPKRIREALKSGDNTKISEAILTLTEDNDGENRNRRIMEAELVKLPTTNQSLVERRTGK